jgi:hypothetical protein
MIHLSHFHFVSRITLYFSQILFGFSHIYAVNHTWYLTVRFPAKRFLLISQFCLRATCTSLLYAYLNRASIIHKKFKIIEYVIM